MRVVNRRDGKVLAWSAETARGLVGRLIGLMGRRNLAAGGALVIPGCRRIHTFFMRFPVDVLYADKDLRVVGVYENIPPWHIGGFCREAAYAIEFPAGAVSAAGVEVGDDLIIEGLGA